MNKGKILIVDDELGIRDLLSSELAAFGYSTETASNGAEAVEKIRKEKFQLVISDVKMPRMDGIAMLEAIKKIDPDVELIMSTGFGTIETAVSAMKKGAYDFIQKPFNMDEILALIDKALEKTELKAIIGVYEASKAIFNSMSLEKLLPMMVDISSRILGADDAAILLMSREKQLAVAAATGLGEQDLRKKSRIALGQRVAGHVAQTGEPVIIDGPLEKDARFSDIPALRDVRSSIVFPLIVEGETVGILTANRTARVEPFTAVELRHAMIFGSQIAQALRNARLYQDLETKIRVIEAMQSQLVQSEKMAALGQLAAGVAHEINNPLTGIMGFTECLLQSEGLTRDQREDLENITHQSERCRKIVQNLLQFSRKRKSQKGRVFLSEILKPTFELVNYDFVSANLAIKMELPPDLPAIYGDCAQLEQVFLNLATNARHALGGRTDGVLTVRAGRQGDAVVIRLSDNGCGIAPENINKIFDPFFTTKPVGQGTGLGLSISYGIIKDHNGDIRVESEVGKGTSFIIELPAAAAEKKEELWRG